MTCLHRPLVIRRFGLGRAIEGPCVVYKGLLALAKLRRYTCTMFIRWALWSPADWLFRRNLDLYPMPRLPISWSIFFMIAAILIISAFLPPLPIEPTFPRPITATILLAFYLLFLQVALRLLGLKLSDVGLSKQRFLREVLAGIGVYLVVASFAVISSTAQGMPPRPDWPNTFAYGSLYQQLEIAVWLSRLIINALAVGVMEEMIYRGLVVTFLLTRWNTREGALWLSSLIFALAHIEFELPILVGRIALGYIFGLLYIWRKNLTAAITMHTLHNFCVWAGLLGSA